MKETPYTHGLEEIYAIRNVDLGSVRTLESDEEEELNEKAPSLVKNALQLECRFDNSPLDLNEFFFLNDTIRVLNLSHATENYLVGQGAIRLGDVKNIEAIPGGMQQEIHEKLERYEQGKRSDLIHWDAVIRGAHCGESWSSLAISLESIGLSDIVPLRVSEKGAVNFSIMQEGSSLPLETVETLKKYWKWVLNASICPWVERRCGLATRVELEERLEKVSVGSVLQWFERLFEGDVWEIGGLIPVGGGFATSLSRKREYEAIQADAKSYFYGGEVSYPLDDLMVYLEKEWGRRWLGFPRELTEKSLSLSFYLYRSKEGVIMITPKPQRALRS